MTRVGLFPNLLVGGNTKGNFYDTNEAALTAADSRIRLLGYSSVSSFFMALPKLFSQNFGGFSFSTLFWVLRDETNPNPTTSSLRKLFFFENGTFFGHPDITRWTSIEKKCSRNL